jgi:transcriptional regulator with XRE-family HTH domain
MKSAARRESPFGVELRFWRARRGLSQLRLAVTAGMSPRYLSFVETGRSRPGRMVIERLAEALDIPPRDRNRLLVAAGIAPSYPEGSLDEPALSPFRRVVDSMLAKHEPYPAMAFDRDYRLVRANAAAHRLIPGLEGGNWLDLSFAPGSPIRAITVNFAEVAWAAMDLLRRESNGSLDALGASLERLQAHLADVPRPRETSADDRVICPRFRVGDRVITTTTTIARFGSARDITLDELRVELMFPADEDSARFFVELAGDAASSA